MSGAERSKRPGEVPYYGANGQVGWIDKPLFDEPLVLLAEDGGNFEEWMTRPVAYEIDGPSWVNNHAHVLRAIGVTHDWLYYSLRHRDLTHIVNMGTRSKLNQRPLRQLPIAIVDDADKRTTVLRAIEHVASGAAREAEALAAVRRTLLSRLMSGLDEIPASYDRFLADAA